MINISKSGNAIKFAFTDSDHYLYGNGEIEVPVNSLSLIVDESNMVTFRKANSNDIFLSFNPANSNLSDKAGVINFYKTNMVGSTGGGGGSESGITSGEVQTMIDNSLDDYYDKDEVDTAFETVNASLSGKADTNYVNAALGDKADTSAVTAVANDVSTLSGQVATKVNTTDFSAYSAATDARIAEDEEVTAAALNDLDERIGDPYQKVSGLTIDYDSEVTSPEVRIDTVEDGDGEYNVYINKWGLSDEYLSEDELSTRNGYYSEYGMEASQVQTNEEEGREDNRTVTVNQENINLSHSIVNTDEAYDELDSRAYITENTIQLSKSTSDGVDSQLSTIEINADEGTFIHFEDGVNGNVLDINSENFDWTDGTDTRTVSWSDIATIGDIPEYSAGTGIEISGNVISATGGGGVLVINLEDLTNNMTDDKWDELANALENDIPIFSVIDASGEGTTDIQQSPVNGMLMIDENEGTSEITLNQLFGGGYYEIHIQKNGSEDYTITRDWHFVPNELSAGTGIDITDNVISCTVSGGSVTVDATLNSGSTNPVANSAITSALDGKQNLLNSYVSDVSVGHSGEKTQIGKKMNGDSAVTWLVNFGNINGKRIGQWQTGQSVNNFSLVETSAVTSAMTSGSTDSEIPSAKCVYDALGGLKLVQCTQAEYDALVSGGTVDSSTIYFITNVVS